MKKKISKAFNKNVYLLGKDKNGIYYWLKEPRWDCGWYWGFGYIETYTYNKRPDLSKNTSSGQDATNFMSKWFIEWNGSKPILKETTFSKEEGWELSELFEQFYFLKEAAEMFSRGKAYVAKSIIPTWEDKGKVKEINEILIPRVTKRILEILTP